jgi:hypothetical protein
MPVIVVVPTPIIETVAIPLEVLIETIPGKLEPYDLLPVLSLVVDNVNGESP